jgi:signal transduction histidine kinase
LKIFDVHPDWTNTMLAKESLPAAKKDGLWKGECAFLCRDGREIPVLMVLLAHKSSNGEVEVFSVISRDISDLKRTAQELKDYADALEVTNRTLEQTTARANDMADQAQCANRAKSEFLANMSHEIRTPMTAILGYADLIADENIGPTTREHVAVIKRNGKHLLALINDILDLSKIEAEKLQIEPTRCSPAQLVAEVVSLMRTQAAAKQLKLTMELAGALPETVLTDPLRLHQVLVNLVGNAIKFTDHGEVGIAVRLTADSGHPRLRFDVADTGIGINADQVGNLFQPFSQVAAPSASSLIRGHSLAFAWSKRARGPQSIARRLRLRLPPTRSSCTGGSCWPRTSRTTSG